MIVDYTKVPQIYLVCGKTDLRRGIDGLASLVHENFNLDPYSEALFLFCGNRSDRYKALYWDKNGFMLLYKRLETGKLQWPRNSQEVQRLNAQQIRWLLEGLSINQPRAIGQAVKGYIS